MPAELFQDRCLQLLPFGLSLIPMFSQLFLRLVEPVHHLGLALELEPHEQILLVEFDSVLVLNFHHEQSTIVDVDVLRDSKP